jgi:hypothetical protein
MQAPQEHGDRVYIPEEECEAVVYEKEHGRILVTEDYEIKNRLSPNLWGYKEEDELEDGDWIHPKDVDKLAGEPLAIFYSGQGYYTYSTLFSSMVDNGLIEVEQECIYRESIESILDDGGEVAKYYNKQETKNRMTAHEL